MHFLGLPYFYVSQRYAIFAYINNLLILFVFFLKKKHFLSFMDWRERRLSITQFIKGSLKDVSIFISVG